MSRFEAEPLLGSLKSFQRRTVDHVAERFYGAGSTSRRFLVADETGLGKSVVARGVIAKAIEHLQDDDSVDRIDIVYVCSNADIADQNIKRLDVTGQKHRPITSRLTLLAKQARHLAAATAEHGKPVNLVSFTPGTSFEMGWRAGKAEERAMLHLLLERILDLRGRPAKSSLMLLQGGVQKLEVFKNVVEWLRRELDDDIDAEIAGQFETAARNAGLLDEFATLIEDLGRKQSVSNDAKEQARNVIAKLRAALARASVATLEPDLVILDEFQRFRHLLDLEKGGEAAELAHHLFDYGAAKVLLLSATPYKPLTFAQEAESGEDHYKDFVTTLKFLAQDSPLDVNAVAADLASYRHHMIEGRDTTAVAQRIRDQLLMVMSRTERPQSGDMLVERSIPAQPTVPDLLGFAALRNVARAAGGDMTVEYWKSAPYFANFMDGYQLLDKVKAALSLGTENSAMASLLLATQRVDPAALLARREIDLGGGRLRALASDTVGQGWWRLLWVPPSMPYLTPAGPYAESTAAGMTKRLIFSSWTATPTAVASLLAFEAERLLTAGGEGPAGDEQSRPAVAGRLEYRLDGDRPGAMSTLSLFWPHPTLAGIGDPLVAAGAANEEWLTAGELASLVEGACEQVLPPSAVGPAGEGVQWKALFAIEGGLPPHADEESLTSALAGLGVAEEGDSEVAAPVHRHGLLRHVSLALEATGRHEPAGARADELIAAIAALASHAPGNIAYRALSRLIDHEATADADGLWVAAATLASGLRSLFNRPDTITLLDRLYPSEQPYWRAVLRYCADGNLQAVLDEYLHQLRSETPDKVVDNDALLALAQRAREALTMRPSRYLAFDPGDPERPIAFTSRFALRYGGRKQDQESARQPQIREAFNSPFWPFVLATTSVGQEGIDFHWWSHSVVHWNVPANPVDFEQREGRVNRFGGHAVRRNIAARHRRAVFSSGEPDPWKAAYDLASGDSHDLGEFAPFWLYPGAHKIERILLPFPLSKDGPKARALKHDLALYRLAFGQPRQEDLLDLLSLRGSSAVPLSPIDLRP